MSLERVKEYFKPIGLENKILVLSDSSATVEEAAAALGCEPKEIAKTLSLYLEDNPILIVTAGDAKIDNKKYRDTFHQKARMIPAAEVKDAVGHAPGGVCPFAIPENVKVYLDVSLKRFEYVYPACGNGHSAIKLTIPELETYSHFTDWIDVCKGWYTDTQS